jgi:hypothetical protein
MYLRNKVTGAISDNIDKDSPEYQLASEMRIQAGQTETGMSSPVSAGNVYPLWEDVPQEDVGFDPGTGRVLFIALAPAAAGVTETTAEDYVPEVAGTLTNVLWVPQTAYTGIVTNNRTVTLQQITVTATPTRVTTALANKALDQTVSVAAFVGVALTITTAAFLSREPLNVVSAPVGAGQADPGGLLVATYTRV